MSIVKKKHKKKNPKQTKTNIYYIKKSTHFKTLSELINIIKQNIRSEIYL